MKNISHDFINCRKKVLSPVPGSNWACEMVLNPAIIKDPDSDRIHMLFRATGSGKDIGTYNGQMPYPIYLGYGFSDDNGETWEFDLENPALAPALEYQKGKIRIKNINGDEVVNYSNGCIEDPRFCEIDDEYYITVACRMFPPGAYWIKDDPIQCAPAWSKDDAYVSNWAVYKNYTVTVLYKVDLKKLSDRQYSEAFTYVTNLTDAKYGEDRDVVFFPERLNINGASKLVMLHRPVTPDRYPFYDEKRPSISVAVADKFEDFAANRCQRYMLAVPCFEWERDRIGASAPPIKIGEKEWLLCYHGKQDDNVGYTQSFMILKECGERLEITSRPEERLITAVEEWEMPKKFKTPCIFIDGIIKMEGELIISYGAADEFVGIMKVDYNKLIKYLRTL